MGHWDESTSAGQAALDGLYALQTAALKQGNLSTQKALEDDIDDLTYKLTQFRSLEIDEDETQITALNSQLDAVTATAKSALADLGQPTRC
jgi:polyhydroxyalkanoate synthesis regulator phasin